LCSFHDTLTYFHSYAYADSDGNCYDHSDTNVDRDPES